MTIEPYRFQQKFSDRFLCWISNFKSLGLSLDFSYFLVALKYDAKFCIVDLTVDSRSQGERASD